MKRKRPSFLERIPRALNVLAGRERKAVRANYHGAEVSRILSDWFARCMAPDDEIRGDMMLMRARARDLSRNDPLVTQFLNLLAANVVGARGPRMQARVRDSNGNLLRDVNAMIEEKWQEWSSGPVTADRRHTLAQFAHLQLRTWATDGERITHLRPGADRRHGLALAAIDPDLLDETYTHVMVPGIREVRLGVEIDGDLAPQRYWFWDRARYTPQSASRQRYPIDANNILHQFSSHRVNQVRGITWLAPIMILIQHLEQYTEAAVVAARVGAAATVFIRQTDPSLAVVDEDDGDGSAGGAADGSSGSAPASELSLSPGSALRLRAGEDTSSFTPNYPNTAFPEFTKPIERRIATGLTMAYNTLANDLEGVNFSSIRHGLQIEKESWEMLAEADVAGFWEPIRLAWLQSAILSGELELPGSDWRRFSAARWIQRGRPYVNPLQDRQAQQLALQMGSTSLTRICAGQGEDVEEILEEIANEKRIARQYGIDIHGGSIVTVVDNRQGAQGDGSSGPGDGGGDGSGDGGGDGAGGDAADPAVADAQRRAGRTEMRDAVLKALNGHGR